MDSFEEPKEESFSVVESEPKKRGPKPKRKPVIASDDPWKSDLGSTRKPVGHGLNLDIPLHVKKAIKDSGLRCRFFNDIKGGVEGALQAGYKFVDPKIFNDHGKKLSPGTRDAGYSVKVTIGDLSVNSYLMVQPEEFFQADKKLLREKNLEVKRQLQSGDLVGDVAQEFSGSNTYAPNLSNGKTGYSELE